MVEELTGVFDTILVANRGEIACRVIRTARAMGLRTVAVHSEPDRGALHVEMADAAVALGGVTAAESYLRGDAIIGAAQAMGAGAIHPGYGFLSENPDFVEAVEAAGLTFIGPSAKAIRAMGLKGAAKALMAEAGVPVVPGYHDDDQSEGRLRAAAEEAGYPVLIKAVAGGGGKGMRRVESADDFEEALASARAEARAAFGDDRVLIEKYVATPRHIELQVFGDGERAVHLFERDCSLQRRHQKVIEEAPAPGMTEEMRSAMGEAAVRAAEAVGYKGAGTVEFIVDASDGLRPDRFWFMEMNTRLQVEHPVTEAVTGVDLVEWQIRVARGEPLPMGQEELRLAGHAVEARIYAEDAAAGFLPATGPLLHVRFPEGARIDTGVREGDRVTPYYDPMIAKVTVHGVDRADAFRKMSAALSGTEIAGTVTNVAFLARLAAHPDVRSGAVETGLIAREVEKLTGDREPPLEIVAVAAAGALDVAPGPLTGFTLWEPLVSPLRIGEHEVRVDVRPTGMRVEFAGASAEVVSADRGTWSVNGVRRGLRAVRVPGAIHVFGDAEPWQFDLPDPLAQEVEGGSGDEVRAPMPGRITSVAVTSGEAVAERQRLLVMEAMKMELTLRAPRAGTIAEVRAAEGAQVEARALLVRLDGDE